MFLVRKPMFLVFLIALAQSRVINFVSTGQGSNLTMAFIDPFSRMAEKSTILTDAQRSSMCRNARTVDGLNGINLGNCVLNERSGVSTCNNGILFYPYYIQYSTTRDTLHPERVGRWIGEEYGWMTMTWPRVKYGLFISSYMVYHYPGNSADYEVFRLASLNACALNPPLFPYYVTGDMFSVCSRSNYTLAGNTWYVNSTYVGV